MHTEIEIAGWVVAVDIERTTETYAAIPSGGSEKCDCATCRNFRAALATAFTPQVLDFFTKVGIDPSKDAEVYEFGETSPGIHAYGGEYYLWGIVVREPGKEAELAPGFRLAFTLPSPLAQSEFYAEGALCFLFDAQIPWVLENERRGVGDNSIKVDEEGFLVSWSDWSEEVTMEMARHDNFVLKPDHWQVITFLREHYKEHQIFPPVRLLTKAMQKMFGLNKVDSTKYLYDLFPSPLPFRLKRLIKYAGLPRPTGLS